VSSDDAERVARALLYEGYLLYPYRGSSLKNQHRFGIGCLFPDAFARAAGEASEAQAECLVEGDEAAILDVRGRFLQVGIPGELESAAPGAIEREVALRDVRLGSLLGPSQRVPFGFCGEVGTPRAASPAGSGWRCPVMAIEGQLTVRATRLEARLFKLTVRIENLASLGLPDRPDVDLRQLRDLALPRALCSAHVCLVLCGGGFVSAIDPPATLREEVAACAQEGLWPVLLGSPGTRDTMLAAPIVLQDHPQVAPESPGDLFDATEIDEILSLRILTLTDEEKREIRRGDPRARALLERTEALGTDELLRLHGALRELRPQRGSRDLEPTSQTKMFPVWGALERPPLATVRHGERELSRGLRVRLAPRGGADAMDLMLAGKTATICSIEQDYEDRVLLAVVLDDDPGRDLGERGWPGHRFFFRPDEVEPIGDGARRSDWPGSGPA